MENLNPYQAPTAGHEPEASSGFYRSGKYLMVRDGVELPMEFCPVSGEACGENAPVRTQRLSWFPTWLFLAIALPTAFVISQIPRSLLSIGLGTVFLLVAAMILRKRCSVVYRMSPAVKAQIRRRKIGCYLLIALGLGMGFLVSPAGWLPDSARGFFFWSPLMVPLGLLLLSQTEPLQIRGQQNEWSKLAGCSKRFLKTLPDSPFDSTPPRS